MRVAVYARVSTKDQSPETQLVDLRAFCAGRGWTIVKEFVDVGISGAKDDRPALHELMTHAKRRLVDVVLVWRFDRFARSTKHLVNTLSDLTDLRIHFVSYQEGLDTTTAQGRLVFSLVSAIAEFERELIRERVQAGIRRAQAEGIPLGRPRTPIDIEKARQLQAQGVSLREIGAEFGTTASTIMRALQKPSTELSNASDGEKTEK